MQTSTKKQINIARGIPSRFLQLVRVRYPKITLLIISGILAYLLFTTPAFSAYVSSWENGKYGAALIAGFLFSFGFTTPFAIGLFLTLNTENIFFTALIGGAGALLADLLIFKIMRYSFIGEFHRLEKTTPFRMSIRLIKKSLPHQIQIYLLYALAGIIIASPLPDEIGVSLLAGLTTIEIQKLAIVSFIMNAFGIFIILLLGNA